MAVPYEGKVTVKIRIKDKIVSISGHNNAEYLLKKLFAQIMTGNISTQYGATSKLPQFLNISASSDDGVTWKSILTAPVPLTSKEYMYEDGWIAKFSAVVNVGNIADGNIQSSDTRDFRLELMTDKNMLSAAELSNSGGILAIMNSEDFGPDVLSRIVPGTSGVFEWQVKLVDINEQTGA